MSTNYFECKYCLDKFVDESRYQKHSCNQKKRFEQLDTLVGKSAFKTYRDWMTFRGYASPAPETFVNSRYFNMFLKFNEWAKKINLADRKGYIKYMLKLGLQPMFWSNNDAYEKYMRDFEQLYTPMDQAVITLKTLHDLAEIIDCRKNEIFKYLTVGELIQFITCKKMSPWVLLFSQSFNSYLRHNTTPEERIKLNAVINPTTWSIKFQNNPAAVKEMQQIIKDYAL